VVNVVVPSPFLVPASRSATVPSVHLDGSLYALAGFACHMTHVGNFVILNGKLLDQIYHLRPVAPIWERKLCAATSSLDHPSLGHRNAA